MGECAGRSLLSRLARTPSATSSASSSVTASRSPLNRTERGPLEPAKCSRSPPHRPSRRSISARDARAEARSPSPVAPACAWLHNATTWAASSSVSAPATWAAAISPRLAPTTAAGSRPQARHSSASETMTANRTGWTTSTARIAGAPGASRSTSCRSQGTCGSSASAQARMCRRKTSEDSSRSRAIPCHWGPCPGKTKTGRRSAPPSGSSPLSGSVALTTMASKAPSATARSPRRASVRLEASTTARRARVVRVLTNDSPRSARSSAGEFSTSRCRAVAPARRAASLCPESTSGTSGAVRSVTPSGPAGAAAGRGQSGAGSAPTRASASSTAPRAPNSAAGSAAVVPGAPVAMRSRVAAAPCVPPCVGASSAVSSAGRMPYARSPSRIACGRCLSTRARPPAPSASDGIAPTRARSMSPRRSRWVACARAVRMARRSKVPEPAEPTVAWKPSRWSRWATNSASPSPAATRNTPVRPPGSVPGTIPPSSRAAHASRRASDRSAVSSAVAGRPKNARSSSQVSGPPTPWWVASPTMTTGSA